jgi:dolichyl-diphosphooligosaccharide--protein glycosyltransferase
MDVKNLTLKIAPIIIVLILVLTVFAIRAETINLGGISDPSLKELYQDDSGMPYFTELDSYYNYRLTENYLNTGHLGDTVVNGTDWDSLSTSPNGREANYQPMIIVLAASVYKFLNSFRTLLLLLKTTKPKGILEFISLITFSFSLSSFLINSGTIIYSSLPCFSLI